MDTINFMPGGDAWTLHPVSDDRRFATIDMRPQPRRLRPPPQSCAAILAYIREGWCGGDVARYRWVMSWLAGAAELEPEAPGTYLAIGGEAEIGASDLVLDALRHLFGKRWLQLGRSDQAFGFGLILAPYDGAFRSPRGALLAVHPVAMGLLMPVITDRRITVEMQAREPVEVVNRWRVILLGDAPADDRRACRLNGSAIAADLDALRTEVQGSGIWELAQYLADYDSEGVDLSRPPVLRDDRMDRNEAPDDC